MYLLHEKGKSGQTGLKVPRRRSGQTSPTSSVSSCASASTMPAVVTLSWSNSSAASYWRAAAHCSTALRPAAIPRLRPAPCTCTAPLYRLASSRTACTFPEPFEEEYRSQHLPAVEQLTRGASHGAITSGSLVSVPAALAAGGFDDALFIDYVDFDFNERLLLNGYRQCLCSTP